MIPTIQPRLPVRSGAGRTMIDAFGGIDCREAAGNGSIRWAENLRTEALPVLRSRRKRRLLPGAAEGNLNGMLALGEKLLLAVGTELRVRTAGTETVEVFAGLSDSKKAMAALGERVVVWPDKLLWTEAGGLESLEAAYTGEGLSFEDGTYAGEEAKANSIVTAGEPFPFQSGDGVTVGACGPTGGEEITLVVREVSEDGKTLRFYENSFVETGTVEWKLTLKRSVPDLDFLCVNENRVWGCKGDTVWCCKLGDPYNWNVFDGLSTDAWSVESGTGGSFTGCISYLGYPCFFKEDRVFKVYGSKPSNFELIGSATLGVLPGAADTMAVAGESLIYLSRAGFVRYNGGMPQPIGDALGDRRYTGGTAGSDGMKYFVSADGDTLVYDVRTGAWMAEDGDFYAMQWWNGALYAIREDGTLVALGEAPAGAEVDEEVNAWAEFGDFDFRSFDGKYPTRLWIRCAAEQGLHVAVRYDGGEWEPLGEVPAGGRSAQYLPFPVRRCERFALRLEGVGDWTVWAIEIESRQEADARK